ncbi:MAG: pilus assembly protein TadG-related protein [Planctomycetes bacterium]|nr:pilus assembly protein TadG-related protein [Planctomycetota bacterium]
MKRKRPHKRQSRKGAITILAAILSVVLIGMVAFSVDIGYVLSAKEDLQRSADAAALAACWEYGQKLSDGSSSAASVAAARSTAANYAALNQVTGSAMSLDQNSGNSPDGDVVFGYISDFKNSQSAFETNSANGYNAIRVRLRKNSSINGEVPYFFARVFGMDGQVLQSEAVAGMIRDIRGFQAPANGENVDLLPYALDLETWNDLVAGNSSDNYSWNAESKQIGSGSDGFVEVNLFPQGTGSPGNRGTIDIGGANNSTSDIARQILHGISPEDFAAHAANGRSLEFDEGGALYLNGDTGISSGVKDELAAIKGQPRVIPIFESVTQNGNNAEYKIVRWQGIRIMAVKLTGAMSQKHVTIQVAPVLVNGVIPSTTTGTSKYVYSPVVLVR